MRSNIQEVEMDTKAFSHYMGKAGEYLAMAALTARGYKVYLPTVSVGDADFIVDIDGELLRIQVKCVSDIYRFEHNQPYTYRYVELRKSGRNSSRHYSVSDIDALIIVDLEEGDAYWFDMPMENKAGMYKTKVKEKGKKIFPIN